MKIARTRKEWIEARPETEVGFVPTMGALHEGHAALVKASKNRGLYTVVSIFVNPSQFNNQGDYTNYPVRESEDIALLTALGCDLVFIPSVDEVYRDEDDLTAYVHSFGALEEKFEGEFRPNHFRGVGQVVHILFDIVRPSVAFFGEKDFQQLAVIHNLVLQMNSNIQIVGVPTKREASGLAMSSRNLRLSEQQLSKATLIYECLTFAKQNIRDLTIQEIEQTAIGRFEQDPEWNLEYFKIIDPATFASPNSQEGNQLRAIVAAHLGAVRLIDNMDLTN